MVTWKDVAKAFIGGMALLLMVLAALWAWETQWKIDALQSGLYELRAAQRPLVELQGKYLTVFAQEKEVIIETRQGERP